MDVSIISVAGEVSFEDGSITNILMMRTPSGRYVRAIITDESARVLYEDLASIRTGAPHVVERPAAPPPPMVTTRVGQERDSEGNIVFGGGTGEEEAPTFWQPQSDAPAAPSAPPPEPEPPKVWTDASAQAKAYQRAQSEQRKRQAQGITREARVVQKDVAGNPVIRMDGVDPDAVIGKSGGAMDEDGIGQV